MSKKTKQDDLRRLMKERRENSKVQTGKIDSPFAKYSSSGQLSCAICNVPVKSSVLWGAHISGKNHKEALSKKVEPDMTMKKDHVSAQKRTIDQPDVIKKVKTTFKTPDILHSSSNNAKTTSLLSGYSSSDESEGEEESSRQLETNPIISNQVLPPDFFDTSAKPNSDVDMEEETSSREEGKPKTPNTSNTLPEGFFDDPVLDAKARNIEYKDPVEEEWEKFQKTIAEESNVSKNIIQEDLAESTLERGIEQIDEQIHQWERVKNLEILAEDAKVHTATKEGNPNDMELSDEELDEDDLLDWRSKSIKR